MLKGKLKVGVALSATGKAEDDCKAVVSTALKEAGDAKVVVVFESFGDYERKKAHRGMREARGSVPLAGCCVAGLLSSKGARSENGALALALGGDIEVQLAKVEECHGRYKDAGVELATAVGRPDRGFLILFGDCHGPGAKEAVAGLQSVLREKFPMIGGSAVQHVHYHNQLPEFVYFNDEMDMDAIIGVMVKGDFDLSFAGKVGKECAEIVNSAGEVATRMMEGFKGKKPQFVFASDCMARMMAMEDRLDEELQAIVKAIGVDVPMAGFYGGGEVGPLSTGQPADGYGYHVILMGVA